MLQAMTLSGFVVVVVVLRRYFFLSPNYQINYLQWAVLWS